MVFECMDILRRIFFGLSGFMVICFVVVLVALCDGRAWLGAGFALLPLFATYAILSRRHAREV